MVMPRKLLRVDGVSPETVARLQDEALQLYGKKNASLMVRSLIAAHLSKSNGAMPGLMPKDASDSVRVQLRLPRAAVERLNVIAEGRISDRNYYMTSVVLSHLGEPQLQGDEIEVLRRSNYELSRIGTNLNQVAKAFNTLVKMRSGESMPEVGKRIAAIRREVTEHTARVLRVLEAGSAIWELRGRGQKNAK